MPPAPKKGRPSRLSKIRSNAGRGTQFSKTRQPKGKTGRKIKAKPGDGRFSEEAVRKLAEKGVEGADIARHLRLHAKLQTDRETRTKFDEAVADGHSTHRVQLAEVAKREADKGKSNALRDQLKAWLARYSDEVLTGEDEAGIIARIQEQIERLKRRKKENAARGPV